MRPFFFFREIFIILFFNMTQEFSTHRYKFQKCRYRTITLIGISEFPRSICDRLKMQSMSVPNQQHAHHHHRADGEDAEGPEWSILVSLPRLSDLRAVSPVSVPRKLTERFSHILPHSQLNLVDLRREVWKASPSHSRRPRRRDSRGRSDPQRTGPA